MSFDSLRKRFKLKENKLHPIKEILGYNIEEQNITIKNLEYELEEQKNYNQLLKHKNIEKNQKELTSFVETYEDDLEEHYHKIKILSKELKQIISENNQLEKQEEKYNKLKNNPKILKIAQQIKEFKKIKQDLLFFLKQNGTMMV